MKKASKCCPLELVRQRSNIRRNSNIRRDKGPKASFAGEAHRGKVGGVGTRTTDRGSGRESPTKVTDTQDVRDAEGPMNDTDALALGLAARGGEEASISAQGGTRAAAESTLTPSSFCRSFCTAQVMTLDVSLLGG